MIAYLAVLGTALWVALGFQLGRAYERRRMLRFARMVEQSERIAAKGSGYGD